MSIDNAIGNCPSCNAAILPSHRKLECPACGAKLPSEITVQLPFVEYGEASEQPGCAVVLYILAFLSLVGGVIAGVAQVISSNYLDSSAKLFGKQISEVAFWSGVGLISNGVISAAVLYAIGQILEHVVSIRANKQLDH